jgi:hypothetical protein
MICLLCQKEIAMTEGKVEEWRRQETKNVYGEPLTIETHIVYCARCWVEKIDKENNQ